MSTTDQTSEDDNAVNRLESVNDEFVRHSLFSDQSEDEQICSRAIKTLHFLCPEICENQYVIPDSIQNVEENN